MTQNNHFLITFSSQKDRQKSWIIVIIFVLCIHLILIGSSFLHTNSPAIVRSRPKVVVQTVQLNPSNDVKEPSIMAFLEEKLEIAQPSILAETKSPLEKQERIIANPEAEPFSQPLQKNPQEQLSAKEPLVKPSPQETSPKALEKEKPKPEPKPSESPKKAATPAEKKAPPAPPQKASPKTNKTSVMPKKTPSKKEPEVKKATPTTKPAPKVNPVPSKKDQEKIAEQKRSEEKKRQEQLKLEHQKREEQRKLEEKHAAEILKKQQEAQAKLANLNQTHPTNIGKTSSSNQSVRIEIPQEIVLVSVNGVSTLESSVSTEGSSSKAVNYWDKMHLILKRGLTLPDYGAVEIKLTLNKKGKVVKVEIVKSKSAKNTAYIEKTLPSLIFPTFDNTLPNTDQYTFPIKLDNGS